MTSGSTSRPQVVLVNRCFILNEKKEILLIKRADSDSYCPGMWECPGGKLDQGQDLVQAREREVFEETGLKITLTHPLVYANSYISQVPRYVGMPYIELYGIACPVGREVVQLSSEHSAYAWVSYTTLFEYELTTETRKAAEALKQYLS